jgi:hypothetical protein
MNDLVRMHRVGCDYPLSKRNVSRQETESTRPFLCTIDQVSQSATLFAARFTCQNSLRCSHSRVITKPKYSNVPAPSLRVSTSTLHTPSLVINGRMKCGCRHVT